MNTPIKKLPCRVTDIMEHIPHRYPFLLVDMILDYKINSFVKAQKNVTFNEPYFEGHFPTYPIMPGVLILESLAQISGILTTLGAEALDSKHLYFLAGVNNVRFKKPVLPGDILILHSELSKSVKNLYKYKTQALVNDLIVAEAEIMLAKGEIRNEQNS